MRKAEISLEEMAKGLAYRLDRIQFPQQQKAESGARYDDQGRRIVTYAELEADQERVSKNNLAAIQALAGA